MNKNELTMEKLVSLCKQYGFIFQGSEIYGGLANTWDYGPYGSRLKNNIKDAWRKHFIQERPSAYELDSAILMHPSVWKASGHVDGFADPLIECKKCHIRYRADHLIDDFDETADADGMTWDEMNEYIIEHKIPCPNCNSSAFTTIRQFSQMFETSRGVVDENKNIIYLRPENAQGEYINFLNVQRSTRSKLPFSIGQIGKAFRNEITPKNFTYRTIEFEQMEYQTFCQPREDEKLYKFYKDYAKKFFVRLGIPENKLRYHDHEKLSFYAKEATDIEYLFPFGWGEINGTHNRTDYDLSQHQKFSGISMEYLNPDTKEKFIPYIVESTVGADRATLAILCNAYTKETLEDGTEREYLNFHPYLAPYKATVLPLIKKQHSEKAKEIYQKLSQKFMVNYDETGSIGKRYRRADIIGTPFCITIDDNTINDGTVTVRNITTMKQTSVKLDELEKFIFDRIQF